jgi:ABC-type nickel/cobalt efflux system permease component RcnA
MKEKRKLKDKESREVTMTGIQKPQSRGEKMIRISRLIILRNRLPRSSHFCLFSFVFSFTFSLLFFLLPSQIFAHPMGNFSISHYSGIKVEPGAIRLRYIIDMAEIPTFQEITEMDTDGDRNPSPSESQKYVSQKVEEFKKGLTLTLNKRPLDLQVESSKITFPPGAGNLPTLKIYVDYLAPVEKSYLSNLNQVFYQDNNFLGRAGWKEIIVTGSEGVSIQNASVPSVDRSNELANYPTDILSSPPQDLEASFSFSEVQTSQILKTPEVSGKEQTSEVFKTSKAFSENSKRFADGFTELISTPDLTFRTLLILLVTAFSLGAFHALSPGHGKTVVAAYLVGSRGTAGHALFLGAVVTLTHTIGVFILGLITLYASKYVIPEKLYPWLGFFSGLTIVAIGLTLFVKRYRNLYGSHVYNFKHDLAHTHFHYHPAGHSHSPTHPDHVHSHHHHSHSHHPDGFSLGKERVSLGSLLALGVSGGMVPCPSALVVLLSAISLHRIGLGLVLIVAFSIGLALVLMGIGLLMVYAKQFMDRFREEGTILQRLPLLSSLLITVLGLGIAVQSLISGGVLKVNWL